MPRSWRITRTSIRVGSDCVSEPVPTPSSPAPQPSRRFGGGLQLTDESLAAKWRAFEDAFGGVTPGTSRRSGDHLVWSVSPSEWTVVGPRPTGDEIVDLTHVRAMFRVTGEAGPELLSKLCALDLADEVFPPGRAARTLVAGVATEIVRDDIDGGRSYLLLPSRSFGRHLYDVMVDAATGLDSEAASSGP
jgi:sarcosine oxidase gamma subunit